MRKYKYLLGFLALLNFNCDADEFVFIKHHKVKQEDVYQVPDTITVENKDCPRCDAKEYCNRSTGRCQAVANRPSTSTAVKCESLEGKPVSVEKLAWMDKGGTDLYNLNLY